MVGSAWAEESCSGWSTVSFELVGARVGRLRCSGGSGLGSGEGVRGMRCGGALGAEAHASWGSGALCCASHGDGEVAAAELGWGGVARGGGSSARGGGSRGKRGCHVRRRAKQEVACGLPRRRAAALSPGGAEAERWEMKFGLICNFQKV